MSVELHATYTLTAPSGVDGRGEIAVLNDTTSANFVGFLLDSSGFDSPTVRTSSDVIPEGHGAVHGSFYYGERPFTLDIMVARAATVALSNARLDKLFRATNAMAADGSLVWAEQGAVAKRLLFRRHEASRFNNDGGRQLFAGVSANPRITANTPTTVGAGTFTVGGNTGAFPTFTLTAPTNTITLNRTSPSPTETLTLTGLSGAGTVTVDFYAKTVTATSGTANRYSAVSFPSSVWWELAPGSNTVTVTGATVSGSGISYRDSWI